MDYRQTIDYLFENLPMFHRVGPAALKNNLDNSLSLDCAYNYPHREYKTIHVAGTNGKGSVSHLVAAILQKAGYSTGLFTSPHLKDFRERIRVNGEMIPEKYITDFVHGYIEKNKTLNLQTSFFELTACMAFSFFRDSNVDIAVIEVGLGGRLDSTNIITPVLSVITNISFDHVPILGNTLEKIAREKAGIIKENIPVIIGETQLETENIFIHTSSSKNAPIVFADQKYHVSKHNDGSYTATSLIDKGFANIKMGLNGNYQQKNLATVLATIEALNNSGFNVNEKSIREGLKNVTIINGLNGRWQVIGTNPKIICDTGHNEAGIRFVAEQLKNETYAQLHIVFGVVNDKDIDSILLLLPVHAVYYFTKANVERALNEKTLKEKANTFNLEGESFASVQKAMDAALLKAGKNDLIFIGGSTFVVAEVI